VSPKIDRAAWRQSIGFAVLFVALLGLAGVSVPVAIKAVAVIATQIVSGAYVYARIPRSKSPTIPECLGMGFAIGSALSTLFDIILKSTPIKSVAWLLPSFVILLVAAGGRLKEDRSVVRKIQETKFKSIDFLAITLISFLYLAHDFLWYISLFASGLCVLIAVNLRNKFATRILYLRSAIAMTALAIVSLVAGMRSRPQFWWINSDDYQLFESLQNSLARYGPRDHLGAAGISITAYHFLSYTWTGLLDRLSDAPTWVILNRVTPIVVSLALSALIWSFLTREGVHRPKLRFLLACLYPILFVFSFGSPSSAVGHIFLLAAVFYWTDRKTAVIHWSRIPLGVLFTVFVIGTKIPNAPIVFLGLGALAIMGIVTNQPWRWVSLVDLLTATATGALCYFLFLRNTTAATSIGVEPFGFAMQLFGDLNSLSGPSLIVIGGIASSAYIFIPLLGMITFWSHLHLRASMLGHFVLAIFPLLVMYILFIGGITNSAGYFVNSALSIMLLIALLAVSGSLLEIKPTAVSFKVFLMTSFATGIASYYLLESLSSGSRIAMLGRAVASAYWILPAVIGILWFTFDVGKPRKSRNMISLLSLVLVGAISASVAVTATGLYRTATQPKMLASSVESVIGTPDEIAAARWMEQNLPLDAIIASNHFCGSEECFGSEWFNEQVVFFRKNPTLLQNQLRGIGFKFQLFGGSNLILPAYSERRFLIQGPRFLWGINEPPAWAIDRMNVSLRFANHPSKQTLMALEEFDVEYFVVDLESTAQRRWTPFGKILFQNPSFAILQFI